MKIVFMPENVSKNILKYDLLRRILHFNMSCFSPKKTDDI